MRISDWSSDVCSSDLAIALGVEEVSPLDLASAYLTFADDGTAVEPYAITRIEDGDGNVLWEPDRPQPEAGAGHQDVARARTSALPGGIPGRPGGAADNGGPAAGTTGPTQAEVHPRIARYRPPAPRAVRTG